VLPLQSRIAQTTWSLLSQSPSVPCFVRCSECKQCPGRVRLVLGWAPYPAQPPGRALCPAQPAGRVLCPAQPAGRDRPVLGRATCPVPWVESADRCPPSPPQSLHPSGNIERKNSFRRSLCKTVLSELNNGRSLIQSSSFNSRTHLAIIYPITDGR
jgi:hypothetical protein